MRKVVLALLVSLLSLSTNLAAQSPQPTIPVDQIHAGMRGYALTVFEGVKPESMDVEVLGVLHNVNGPKGDMILVRLHGTKVEYTGVVAGMSGSPVYLDGKLAGALAFRIGEFSKEPIAGVTPIADMLEINALDKSPAEETAVTKPTVTTAAGKTAAPGDTVALPGLTQAGLTQAGSMQDFANYLRPIDAPLVFNGFSEETVRRFAGQFASAGVVPVMGAGSVSQDKQPEPLEAGSAVSAILVRGDMDIAATCTVTYIDPQRLLACGHPLLQFGSVDLPMNKAQVLATLPSPLNAFKIVNTTEQAGVFVQDRHTGILGVFNKQPEMIPVTLTIHTAGGAPQKDFHFEVLNNPRLSPVAIMATVFNALHGVNEYGEEITYRLTGSINVKGFPEVALKNMFVPTDNGQPAAMAAALSLGERFGRIYDNPYNAPAVNSVKLDFDLVRERRWARLESARTDVTEVRPGDEIIVETVLAPYRGERVVRQIPVKIPTSAGKGTLRILVSDGETLDRVGRTNQAFGRKLDLASTIALLNKEHANNRLYVSLLEADPEARVADKVMPTLPISVMNVMEGMRGNQEMIVSGESSVDETATPPLDYVVSGAQLLTVTVK
ncbi:MAG TPA: SpoIVB peptidase S55 domain-containing protein [Candidatus Sulfotelmatobacter sp.]|nr:SpoIVB peptidase S55 domain-containing protein [Candidatus Sulfotelmatobacter sp.]